MKVFCDKCKRFTKHNLVSPDKDPNSKWKYKDTSYLSSCRGVKSDYKTIQCSKCKLVGTYDFATD